MILCQEAVHPDLVYDESQSSGNDCPVCKLYREKEDLESANQQLRDEVENLQADLSDLKEVQNGQS